MQIYEESDSLKLITLKWRVGGISEKNADCRRDCRQQCRNQDKCLLHSKYTKGKVFFGGHPVKLGGLSLRLRTCCNLVK